jgi:hypothetical protein
MFISMAMKMVSSIPLKVNYHGEITDIQQCLVNTVAPLPNLKILRLQPQSNFNMAGLTTFKLIRGLHYAEQVHLGLRQFELEKDDIGCPSGYREI